MAQFSFLVRAYSNAYVVLIVCSLCWGGNAVAGRYAVGEISPMLLTFFRWLGVTLLVWTIARNSIVDDRVVLRCNLRYFVMMGTIGFTGFNILFYNAAHFTKPRNTGILQGRIPIFLSLGTYAV